MEFPVRGGSLAPRNEITNGQGVEEFDEHLLGVDANVSSTIKIRQAGFPDLSQVLWKMKSANPQAAS